MKVGSPFLVFASVVALTGCGSGEANKDVNHPVETVGSAEELAYAEAFVVLMVDFKASTVKATEEMDEAEAKGMPVDRKAKRAVLLQLMERADGRIEELHRRAQATSAPPKFEGLHAAVLEFLGDQVSSNAGVREALRNNDRDALRLSEAGIQRMIENYEKIKLEAEKLGVTMPDVDLN